MKAATSMNRVERGRWKLVSSMSAVRKPVARRDKDIGFAREWRDGAVFARGRF